MLKGKKILLGITASISAYKAIFLVRLLIKEGAEVKVVLTEASRDFVSEITLSTLSKNEVYSSFTKEDQQIGDEIEHGTWNNHVELGEWADVFIVAPCSANTLAKMSTGLCDNLLTAVYLSARCPVWFAPAMDLDMFKHPTTTKNIEALIERGNLLIPPGKGELASGLKGEGRLAEPEDIVQQLISSFGQTKDLEGKKVLVTAGPTYEYIDPVRYIGNPSSGKMGIAIAEEFAVRGAAVYLVCGPTELKPQSQSIQLINVTSAESMFNECEKLRDQMNIVCMSAAVADYTPVTTHEHKVKKEGDDIQLSLKRTKDILKHFGNNKKDEQVLIGFAMETQNALENAQKKLSTKNADLIVLNQLTEKGAGFKHDTNKVTFVSRYSAPVEMQLKAKLDVAKDIVNFVVENSELKPA